MLLHFKILFQWHYEMLHIWEHLQNSYIVKLKLLHLQGHQKKTAVFKTQIAAFSGK